MIKTYERTFEAQCYYIVVDEYNFDEKGVQYAWYAVFPYKEGDVKRTQDIHEATHFDNPASAKDTARWYNEDYNKKSAVVFNVWCTLETVYKRT